MNDDGGRGRRLRLTASLLAVACLSGIGGPAGAQRAELRSSAEVSTEGYFQLTWQADVPVRLVEAARADFSNARVLYQGLDTARVISGKPDGRWFYRLEPADGGAPISEPLTVSVAHHPLQRAVAFFGGGALVFAATLGLVVFGSRSVDRVE